MEAEGTASPTPIPLTALPPRIIQTEDVTLARPIRRKDMRNRIPDRMMVSFRPVRSKMTDEKTLPSIAPSGGNETTILYSGSDYNFWNQPTLMHTPPIQDIVSSSSGADGSA